VLVATLSSFGLGGLCHSPLLFGNLWIRESGYEEEKAFSPLRVFGLSFLFSLIAATTFAVMLGSAPALTDALIKGTAVGICFVATSFGINHQFSTTSFSLLLIDSGYHTLQFVLFGLILGLWH
jgi:hypothetical protein